MGVLLPGGGQPDGHPRALRHPPVLDALEGARTAPFTREEWDAYIAAGMAIQNERGALSLARKEGEHAGEIKGKLVAKRETILRLCGRAGVALTEDDRTRIEARADAATLDRWIDNVIGAKTAAEVLT